MTNQYNLEDGKYALLTLAQKNNSPNRPFDVVCYKIFPQHATPAQVEDYSHHVMQISRRTLFFLTDADPNQLRRNFRNKPFFYCLLHGFKRLCVNLFLRGRRFRKHRRTIYRYLNNLTI